MNIRLIGEYIQENIYLLKENPLKLNPRHYNYVVGNHLNTVGNIFRPIQFAEGFGLQLCGNIEHSPLLHELADETLLNYTLGEGSRAVSLRLSKLVIKMYALLHNFVIKYTHFCYICVNTLLLFWDVNSDLI